MEKMTPYLWEVVLVSLLTNSAIAQVHILGFALLHTNIYPIYDILAYVKRLLQVVCNSMVKNIHGNSKRSFNTVLAFFRNETTE